MLQDHLKGRCSEIDHLNGLVVSKGKEAGIQTTVNEDLVRLTQMISSGKLKPDVENMKLLKTV